MEYNFDKEMDAFLRQAARSGQVVPTDDFDAHLDADEISMFAENALPEKAKMRATKHLAECNNCRSILSNLILLNEETEIEAVSSVIEVKADVVPWYKKLFIFPNIAYAMGGLALVFSGFVGFLIYQTTNQTASFDMAKSEPAMTENKSASGPNAGEIAPELNESSTNTMSANTNSAPVASMDNKSGVAQTANTNAAMPSTSSTPQFSPDGASENERNNKENEPADFSQPEADERKDRTADSAGETSRSDDSPMPQATPAPPPPPAVMPKRSAPKKKSEDNDEDSTKSMSEAETSRRVGGKTFNRVSGGWTDTNYRRQPTTTVRRGTNDYLKLDTNIRVIAESLEGTVIIVSKNKAYRIQ